MDEVKWKPARSYGQFCGVARALDAVGDRWILLIVRELLVRPRRYGELLNALPGIGTNLLADRLKFLVDEGIVRRTLLERPGKRELRIETDRARGNTPPDADRLIELLLAPVYFRALFDVAPLPADRVAPLVEHALAGGA